MTPEWFNPPPRWRGSAARLTLETGSGTDFWRKTFYGFTRDSGHAWLVPANGDFSLSVRFRGAYETLYDQAGLMIRADASRWIKTGIEFTDGVMHFSVVVTAGRSDWSVIPLPNATPQDWITARLTRHDDAIRVQFALNDGPWQLARLAPFTDAPVRAGLMACSPERAGFCAEFEDLTLGPAIPRDLHDNTNPTNF
jgi:regulation of enolase protein 1 (concanavalin A-like superfamily)